MGLHGFLHADGSFIPIDAPGASGILTSASGNNDSGQIVGSFGNPMTHGFLDTHRNFTQIDVPGARSTFARDINSKGQIVGYSIMGTQEIPWGFLDNGGAFTPIFADFPGSTRTEANGINDAGQIVGSFRDGGGDHGFLDIPIEGGSQFSSLTVPGSAGSVATGINNKGQIVGYFLSGSEHGFVDVGGKFTQLDVPGANETFANGINDGGQIVGWYQDGSGQHGFLATPGGTVIGDPWFTTFDGHSYGFQGIGEFTLARSARNGDPFEVQIRTSSWAGHPGRSMVAAVASDLCGHRASFDLDRANAGGSLVSIDGLPSSLSRDDPLLLGDCTITQTSAGTYEAIWGTGEILDCPRSRPAARTPIGATAPPADGDRSCRSAHPPAVRHPCQ